MQVLVAGLTLTASVSDLGSGWYLIALNHTITATCTGINQYFGPCTSLTNRNFTGDTVKGIYAYRAALFQGTLTAAQILAEGGIPLTTTAAASNPSAGKYSWAFDGGDSLALGSVPFQMADDHFVIAGFRADLTAASCLFSIGSTASSSPMCVLDISAGGYRSLWRDDAAVPALLSGGTYVAGTPAVISMRSVSSTRVLRVNGSQAATNTTVLGATTFNVSKIGAQARTTDANFHTGSTGPIISGKGTLTDSEMLTLERLVTLNTPNGPTF